MADFLLAQGWVPDFMVRSGLRDGLTRELKRQSRGGYEAQRERFRGVVESLKSGDIAEHTLRAESRPQPLPPEFFQWMLGGSLKYSCGFWREGVRSLDLAESNMLDLTVWRADIQDGQDVLDLGCGWGSLSLLLAYRFPAGHVTAVTLSEAQAAYVRAKAQERGLKNLSVIRADVNDLETDGKFDRVVSVEMFERMHNLEQLMCRLSSFLRPEGKLFVQMVCHRKFAYFQEQASSTSRLSRFFFKDTIMPNENLLLHFDHDFQLEQQWKVPGTHYQRTCQAWLSRLDSHRAKGMRLFRRTYGAKEAKRWWNAWRVFLMSCQELFGYNKGQEWFVSHILFRKRAD